MSRYIRAKIPGASVFFTVNLAQCGSGDLIRHVDLLRAAVRRTKAERPFAIDAWIVLPDHLHAVWTLPEDDCDYPTRWRLIKARFSRALPKGRLRASHRLRSERGIWQRRFWEHHVRNASEYEALIRYCWSNPVKHGLVERPQDWAYSSIHRDIRDGRCDPL